MMKYKGYIGQVTYDPEAKILHGEVVGLQAVITFQATNVQDIEKEFRASIDDYIEWCKERGAKPEKSFSGNIRLRVDKRMHAKLAKEAALHGISLNALIIDRLIRRSGK